MSDVVTITLSADTIQAALNCLDACASDEKEPARYREWYRAAERELRESAAAGHSRSDHV